MGSETYRVPPKVFLKGWSGRHLEIIQVAAFIFYK